MRKGVAAENVAEFVVNGRLRNLEKREQQEPNE
jgi:hypothetical protein